MSFSPAACAEWNQGFIGTEVGAGSERHACAQLQSHAALLIDPTIRESSPLLGIYPS
jgi:hypothetical protein